MEEGLSIIVVSFCAKENARQKFKNCNQEINKSSI